MMIVLRSGEAVTLTLVPSVTVTLRAEVAERQRSASAKTEIFRGGDILRIVARGRNRRIRGMGRCASLNSSKLSLGLARVTHLGCFCINIFWEVLARGTFRFETSMLSSGLASWRSASCCGAGRKRWRELSTVFG